MPPLGGLLREAGGVPDHPLDEGVGHAHPLSRPAAADHRVVASEGEEEEHAEGEEGEEGGSACPLTEHPGGGAEVDQRGRGDEARGEGEPLERLGLDDHRQETTDAAGPELVGVEGEGAGEETTLEHRPEAQGREAAVPALDQREGDHAEEHQGPSGDPSEVAMTLEGAAADEPPGAEEEGVVRGMGEEEGGERSGDALGDELASEPGLWWPSKLPDPADALVAEAAVDQGVAGSIAAMVRDPGGDQEPLAVDADRGDERFGEALREDGGRDPAGAELGVQDPAAMIEGEEPADTPGSLDQEERRPEAGERVLELSERDLERLGLGPQGRRAQLDPAIEASPESVRLGGVGAPLAAGVGGELAVEAQRKAGGVVSGRGFAEAVPVDEGRERRLGVVEGPEVSVEVHHATSFESPTSASVS